MALAIIWIVLFHSYLRMPIHCLYAVKNIGYGGADIFLFASGIGCWYSLDKNPDPGQFIYRRMRKILPMYECFIVFWILFKCLSDSITITEAVGNVFVYRSLREKAMHLTGISAQSGSCILWHLFYTVIFRGSIPIYKWLSYWR